VGNILINGFSAKVGGGKAIFEDYLSFLTKASQNDEDDYFVITPNEPLYRGWAGKRIHILRVSSLYQKVPFLALFYLHVVPRIVEVNRIEAVLNFGDIVLPVRVPQVYFFDWPYAVYPESVAWAKMSLMNYVRRRVKYYVIRFTLRFATVVIAQTPTMVNRLKRLYGLERVVLVRSPVTVTSMEKISARDFGLPEERTLLLCLANYSPHKNLEIFLPLARLMKQERCHFTIVTTLDSARSKAARNLLSTVEKEQLHEYLINVGQVDRSHVAALFEQCDALLLPTLLESYGLPFVEAMFNKRTIITSDFDFTRDVCGDAAYYFDPLDAKSIYSVACAAFSDEPTRQDKIGAGFKIASDLNDWPRAFRQYQDCLRRARAA
jgi:glycosyltransferase involved in cell wall biosynthesis